MTHLGDNESLRGAFRAAHNPESGLETHLENEHRPM